MKKAISLIIALVLSYMSAAYVQAAPSNQTILTPKIELDKQIVIQRVPCPDCTPTINGGCIKCPFPPKK